MEYADNSCFYGLVFPCEDYRYHEIGILFAIGRTKFQYIAYIFDLGVGLPTLTQAYQASIYLYQTSTYLALIKFI